MSADVYHDIKGILARLDIMAELLKAQDFRTFSRAEISADIATDLQRLSQLFVQLSTDQ